MSVEFLLDRFEAVRDADALVWQDQVFSYHYLLGEVENWRVQVKTLGIDPGTVVVLEADFSPLGIALFISLVEHRCIVVPLTSDAVNADAFIEIAQAEYHFRLRQDGRVYVTQLPGSRSHHLYQRLNKERHAGLVLFSSGSTGPSKAALHDMDTLLSKYKQTGKALRSISFLLFDHIGGINTMFYLLANGGCMVAVDERSPDKVLRSIEKHRVELLPTTPTFINLILLSEAYKRYDLSTLKMVSYGTEPMPQQTINRFNELFPEIEMRQTYGLSEIGILQSKSKRSDSLWMKMGGDGFQTRVVEDVLHIKAETAMLGYLNYPDPFTADGWFVTGDKVLQDGDFFRILGRDSEIINVGGEKVYPAEVESAVLSMSNVADVLVYGSPNAITGQIVCADVQLVDPEGKRNFVSRLKVHCRDRLKAYMVPVKVRIISAPTYSERFKKIRSKNA